MRILLTGASGFLGQTLISSWSRSPALDIFATYRTLSKAYLHSLPRNVTPIIRALSKELSWVDILPSIDCIVYCAGVTPSTFSKGTKSPSSSYHDVNCDALLNLAYQAAACGVKRFIYLSSFSVYGKESATPLFVHSPLNPVGPYALSKLNAEIGLSRLASQHDMHIVTIRVPLVIGTGTFITLSKLIKKNLPLPFKGIDNLRTFVGAHTLASLIDHCTRVDTPPKPLIIAGDKPPLSTPEFVEAIACSSGFNSRLYSIPFSLGEKTLKLFSLSLAKSVYGSLYVDDASLNDVDGFLNPNTIYDSIARCVNACPC